jgi:hypothetical protein
MSWRKSLWCPDCQAGVVIRMEVQGLPRGPVPLFVCNFCRFWFFID